MTTVHILDNGRSLCGTFQGTPSQWPQGHKWARRLDDDVTCSGCLDRLSHLGLLKVEPRRLSRYNLLTDDNT